MERLPVVLLLTGLVALGLSVILGWIAVPSYINNQIKQKVRLVNGTDTFSKWSDSSSVPVFISFRFFNVTNPSQVAVGKEKPKLTELGPYTYQQKRMKTDIRIDEVRDSIFYRQPVTYHFRPDLSNGTEDDHVTTLNLPLIGVGGLVETETVNDFVRVMLNMYVGRFKEEPLLTRRVREFLFDGYYVPMIDTVQNTTRRAILPNSRFGFYYGRNGTDDGVYEIHSGHKDSSQFGNVRSWKGLETLGWWGKHGGGPGCNQINGSDGSLFAPFLRRDATLYLFSPDLCRSLYFTYDRDEEIQGVPGLRFSIPKSMFAAAWDNPENRCFCNRPDVPEVNCPKAGVIDLSTCRNGAPIMASTPHFLDGDKIYLNQSEEGLDPRREDHETYLVLEPNTGLVLEARKRIQINVDIRPFKNLDKLSLLRPSTFPVLWIEESFTVPESTATSLRSHLLLTLYRVQIGKWIFVICSCSLILLGISVFSLRKSRLRKRPYV